MEMMLPLALSRRDEAGRAAGGREGSKEVNRIGAACIGTPGFGDKENAVLNRKGNNVRAHFVCLCHIYYS